MSNSSVLLVVIIALIVLQTASLGVIAYLMKRIIDDKPIAFKETIAAGTKPEILTRADLKVARQYQAEQNFKEKAEDKFIDLEDLPADLGLAEMEKLYGGEK